MTAMFQPEVRAEINATIGQAQTLKAAAQSLVVRNPTEEKLAVEFVSRVAQIKRDNEAARKAATQPLVDQKRALDAAYREPVALLEEADGIVRRALVAYRAEQERIRREAAAAAAEERRRAEEAAEAARRAAAEEAERQRLAAEEAERQRQAEIARTENALRQRVAAMEDAELEQLVVDAHCEPDLLDAVNAELEARQRRRQALADAEAAQAAADAATVAALEAKTAPVAAVAPAGPARAISGSASTTKRWTFDVTDRRTLVQAWLDGKIPDDFIQVNEAAIGRYIRSARDNHAAHPGVSYHQVSGLAVRTAL